MRKLTFGFQSELVDFLAVLRFFDLAARNDGDDEFILELLGALWSKKPLHLVLLHHAKF